jgi:multiple sugar transport system substrate-binding protein
VVLSSTQAIEALDTMIDYINSGASPAAVVTYAEEDARQAFQDGDAVFMRNWPYAWSLLQDDGSPVKGKVGIAPMPHAPGEASAATLGGWSLAISSHSAHPDAAFAFIEFMTDSDQQKYNALQISLNPTRMALYEDPAICAANPFMCDLLDVFVGARPRPAVADYVAFSAILQEEVHDALVGNQTSAAAIAAAQARLQSVAACGTYLPLIHRNQE